jgi:hypothetical protein
MAHVANKSNRLQDRKPQIREQVAVIRNLKQAHTRRSTSAASKSPDQYRNSTAQMQIEKKSLIPELRRFVHPAV